MPVVLTLFFLLALDLTGPRREKHLLLDPSTPSPPQPSKGRKGRERENENAVATKGLQGMMVTKESG
jgi:hypothetical protein